MKKFFLKLAFLILFVALGFLAWRNFEQHRALDDLRGEIAQLEQERRGLEGKFASADRPAKPEEQAAVRQRIEQQTSALRGLAFKSPVHYQLIERADLRRVLVDKIKEQYPGQELRDYGRTLATLGLVPEGADLLNIIVSLYGEQVAGFYDPDSRSLYTFKDLTFSSNLDKMLLAHELTHVLQDQNFDLRTFPLKVKDNDDLALATSALIEGDATVLMTRWYVESVDPGKMLGDLTAIFGQNTEKLREAPAYLREMLLFPYTQGQQFAATLFAAGGNEALDAAFRNPPTCTKDILHPEQFLHQRATPERVELPPLNSADWRLIGNNVLGEFGTRFVLQQGLDAFEAQLLAQGWNGDRYHVYERGPDGPTGLIWITVWNDEPHAAEFEAAYRKVAAKRDGARAAVDLRVRRDGRRVTVLQSSDPSFMTLWGSLGAP
ncbi:MAG TPA: hypothetical protein VL486_11135 [Verrucomicrobiae bacterium]|nr:hypothetical protein [Verrucomicrobiae bacterium]